MSSTDSIASSDHYGVIRVRDKRANTKVWRVSIMRRKILVKRTFSDRRYGGTAEALAKAIEFRDQILSEIQPYTAQEQRAIVRKCNRSGIPGVYHIHSASGNESWMACIQLPDGVKKTKKFSVKKHGDQAQHLAIEARKIMLADIKGYFIQGGLAAKQVMQTLTPKEISSTQTNPSLILDALPIKLYKTQRQLPKSGYIGISFVTSSNYNKFDDIASVTDYWRATIYIDGLKRTRSFNINRLGNSEALRLAILQREAWELEKECLAPTERK